MGWYTTWRRSRRRTDEAVEGAVATFLSSEEHPPRPVAVVPRAGIDDGYVEYLRQALAEVPWAQLHDAYGPADDVPAQLLAVAVAPADVRALAWFELWGDVHHQGTVYEATVPAVPFLVEVARSPEHPDRVEALFFLREIARGDGSHAEVVRRAVRREAEPIVAGWRREPELVRRAVLLLASAFPDLAVSEPGLVELLPAPLQQAWQEALDGTHRREEVRDDVVDRQVELERWALAGWPTDTGTA